jgi:FMN reductase
MPHERHAFVTGLGGSLGSTPLNTLEYVVRSLRAFAVPLVVPIAGGSAFDGDGNLVDERAATQLRHLGEEVAELCLRRRPPLP